MPVTTEAGIGDGVIDGHPVTVPLEVVVEAVCVGAGVGVVAVGHNALKVRRRQAEGFAPLTPGLDGLTRITGAICDQEPPVLASPSQKKFE